MASCFCGCGRDIRLGRRWLSNKAARMLTEHLDVVRGAAERGTQVEGAGDLRRLVSRADRIRAEWAEYVHGTRRRKDLDKDAMSKVIDDVMEARKRLAAEHDFVGWNALRASELWETGVRAPATIADIRDTGTTINNDPLAEIVLRVTPEGEEPFEVRRKVLVSRLELPRVGEPVEVAYDPADRSEVAFRRHDLSDELTAGGGNGGDRLDQIAKLHELHQAGALTAEEFEREKARLLGS